LNMMLYNEQNKIDTRYFLSRIIFLLIIFIANLSMILIGTIL